MNLFDTPGADAAYDRSFDPPAIHEIDACVKCHESGDHDNEIVGQMTKCPNCRALAEKKIKHVMVEIEFDPDDLDKAKAWARSQKYNYDREPVEDLLFAALTSGAIEGRSVDILYDEGGA